MDKAPRIQPSSAIRKDYKQFSDYCHESMEPVIVTNNGVSDLIVMSPEAYYRREAWNRLQIELAKADKQIAENKLHDHDEVFGLSLIHICTQCFVCSLDCLRQTHL